MDEFEAMALAAAAKKRRGGQVSPSKQPQTNIAEQTGSGTSEGIAGMLGLPVDMMTAAINGLLARPQIESTMEDGPDGLPTMTVQSVGMTPDAIQSPVGGGETFRDALSPFISDIPPQTTAQRYGRRIGQEAGAVAIPGGVMMRVAAAPMALAGTQAASALGAGIAGQTSQEIAPGNATADLIASMIGGMAPIAAGRAMRPGPQAPTMEELRARQGSAYADVDASQARLDPTQRQGLIDSVGQRAQAEGMDELLNPKAFRTVDLMNKMESNPLIADVEKKRRFLSRNVAGSLDPSESAIGMAMRDETDAYLKSLANSGNLGPDARATLGRLEDGRAMTSRIKKAEAVTEAVTKAERRAASSGTGGNAVNTTRQNIRAMLDSPKKARGFSGPERAAMEEIVGGTPGVNFGRMVGRLSPTAGALPMMGNMAAMAGGATAGASGALMGAIPGTIGMVAKALAEGATQRQIEQLLATIRNGGPLAAKGISQTETRAAIAALLAQTPNAPQ